MEFKIDNIDKYEQFFQSLKDLNDNDYKSFNSKIIKSKESEIIGIRVPKMREIAKNIAKCDCLGFLNSADKVSQTRQLTHEEITIYGLVIGSAKLPFGEMCERIRRFSCLVNNWACCDTAVSSFKQIRKLKEEYKIEIYAFLKSKNPWQQRVGIITLLDHYLSDETYTKYALDTTNSLNSDNYYVQMAQAWLIATALAKFPTVTKEFILADFSLSDTVKKMIVRKVRDSYRISNDDKEWILGI